MKLYKSERDIELVSNFDVVNKFPCVTVEKWNKWYSLYLVTEDSRVFNIEHEVYGETAEPSIFTSEFKNTWYRCCEMHDHCWSPVHVLSIFAYFGIYMGEEAYKALTMMWVEQHCEEPGWEYEWLPTKELYDKVIVPDNGDIGMCNSFTEEERSQFKFCREDEVYSLEKDIMFNELCRKKPDPIATSSQPLDEMSFDPSEKMDCKTMDSYTVPPSQPLDLLELTHHMLINQTYGATGDNETSEISSEELEKSLKQMCADRKTLKHLLSAKSLVLVEGESTKSSDLCDSAKSLMKYHGVQAGVFEDKTVNVDEGLLEAAVADLTRIKDNAESDIEADHINADKVLCAVLRELGYGKMVDVYDEIQKYYA